MERVWIGIGSNLCNPLEQVKKSLDALMHIPYVQIIACSSYYYSRPLGNRNQPYFLNMVVVIDTILIPEDLLDYLQMIEKNQGRLRTGKRWESRTLDMDILLFGDRRIYNKKLIIPHYDMFNREFVLYPLFELVPNLYISDGKFLKDYVRKLPKNGLKLWITQ